MQELHREDALQKIVAKLKRTYIRTTRNDEDGNDDDNSAKKNHQVSPVASVTTRGSSDSSKKPPPRAAKSLPNHFHFGAKTTPPRAAKTSPDKYGASACIDDFSIRPNDVVCGFGLGRFNKAKGNVLCMTLIVEHLEDYCDPDITKEEKNDILDTIYSTLTSGNGRFIDFQNKMELSRDDALQRLKNKMQWARWQRNSDRTARAQEAVAAELPSGTTIQDLSAQVKVGSQVAVFWPEDDQYYAATVVEHRDSSTHRKPLYIEYDDGDAEWIDLSEHVFRPIGFGEVSNGTGSIRAVFAENENTATNQTEERERTDVCNDTEANGNVEDAVNDAKPGAEGGPGWSEPSNEQLTVASDGQAAPAILVSPWRLIRGTMDEKHACRLLQGSCPGEEPQDEVVQNLLQDLKNERQELKDWAKDKIKAKMVEKAQTLYGLEAISSFDDVVQAWVHDSSPENQLKMHAIIHGQFTGNSAQIARLPIPWVLQMERVYMEKKGVCYDNVCDDVQAQCSAASFRRRHGTGYVYDIIALQLNYQQNAVKLRGKAKHGLYLTSYLKDVGYNEPPGRKRHASKSESDFGKEAKAAKVAGETVNTGGEETPSKAVTTEDDEKNREKSPERASAKMVEKQTTTGCDDSLNKQGHQTTEVIAESLSKVESPISASTSCTTPDQTTKVIAGSLSKVESPISASTLCTTPDQTTKVIAGSLSKVESPISASASCTTPEYGAPGEGASGALVSNIEAVIQKVAVSRNRLLKTSMGEEHAIQFLTGLIFPNAEAKRDATKQLLEQLHDERHAIKAWAKNEIEGAMVEKACELGFDKVTTYDDLVQSWMGDASAENQKWIQLVMYELCSVGSDNTKPHKPIQWVLQMADRFMEENHLVYSEANGNIHTTSQHGYVYDIVSVALDEIRQEVKMRGKKQHGGWLDPPKPSVKTGTNLDAEANVPDEQFSQPNTTVAHCHSRPVLPESSTSTSSSELANSTRDMIGDTTTNTLPRRVANHSKSKAALPLPMNQNDVVAPSSYVIQRKAQDAGKQLATVPLGSGKPEVSADWSSPVEEATMALQLQVRQRETHQQQKNWSLKEVVVVAGLCLAIAVIPAVKFLLKNG
ncbi:TUDOR [Seminavis robusta]|uniref:TUDOR n=1 Tax=Seminavis robusta TaxID=568900 RepID=A0A9N8F4E4_9STRA|nr:TUDOR [Seminavis robusta]|eukprot:Sro3563_g349210.1 TUDOR (1102) ;mRNA; r:2256-5561